MQLVCICNLFALMDKHRNACNINDVIKNHGLKWSVIRHTIVTHFTKPRVWSASQLMEAIEWPDISTIYRNLKKLTERELIEPLLVHNGQTYYEWSERDHHDHVICSDCDAVECVPCPTPKLNSHRLQLHDLCSSCR